MKAVKVENISFSYENDKTILENLSLEIEANSINAILGANGCGKSTLLDCLVGLNRPNKGQIVINGKNVVAYTNKELAKEVAFIPQNTTINIDYSVREFILFGRNPYLKFGQGPTEKDYEKTSYYAEKLGITPLLNKTITRISGGERQLAFICRALTQESNILIFDEPLSALDFGNQNKLLLIFKELEKEGKTIIFTTHNPNQVLDLNCNVLVISEKKVIATGKSESVLDKKLLEKVYGGKVEKAVSHFTFIM